MNHCIDVICSTCGFVFCAMGCTPYSQTQSFEILLDALAVCTAWNEKMHHYSHIPCKRCRRLTVYDYPAKMPEAIAETKLLFKHKDQSSKPHPADSGYSKL